ncbi:MAG: hypothetical protein K2V38_29735 [Gemmataceae bacterium]|nr:hypothetical protein [Gemmataceae bacterium]
MTRSNSAPALINGNPGTDATFTIAFSAPRRRVENVNVVTAAARALAAGGFSVTDAGTHLVHPESGFVIVPRAVSAGPTESGGAQTATTVQVHHPTLVPEGLFEYQYASGDTCEQSVTRGFERWIQTDFVTLLDALRERPTACTYMEMVFPPAGDRPKRVRRIVLGPVGHYAERRPAAAEPEEHPFCPCCLLTRSWETFRSLIEGDGFHGLRLFAMRNPEGGHEADCRVNGAEWENGKVALRAYAGTWPNAGVEFRKQYVVIRSVANETPPPDETQSGSLK